MAEGRPDTPGLYVQGLRCFKDRVRVPIDDGVTGIIGLNNSGKTSLLRLAWELNPLFKAVQHGLGRFDQGGKQEASRSLAGERVASHLHGSKPMVILSTASTDGAYPVEIHFQLEDGGRMARVAAVRNGPRVQAVSHQTTIGYISADPKNNVVLCQVGNAQFNDEPIRELAAALSECMYVGSFRNVINVGGRDDYYDLAVGEQFVRRFHELKAGILPGHNEAIARLQYDIEEIFGFNRFELNATPKSDALQATINGTSYRLSELGAGLAHFILILVNALVRRPTWLLIDEPELNLHATLQTELLLTASAYATRGVVFTTHSLGLARSAGDRILVVSQGETGGTVHPYEDHPRLAQLAGELSFAGTPTLGFDRILLVEGKTDIKAFQQLLTLYGASQRVLVLSLGGDDHINGDSQAELSELLRIGSPIMAIIDSEKPSSNSPVPGPRLAFKAVCESLGIECHILERRAFENYLTVDSVSPWLDSPPTAIGPFDPLLDGWKKRNNWRAARRLSVDNLKESDLGKCLERLVAEDFGTSLPDRGNRRGHANESPAGI